MKRVHSSLNQIEIHHVKNLLEASGVRCTLRNQYLASIAGEVPFDQCAAQLWVLDDEQMPMAEEVLRAWRRARFARGPDWNCPDCGEYLEGQFTQCWNCGSEKTAT